jgi:hypothetical protein
MLKHLFSYKTVVGVALMLKYSFLLLNKTTSETPLSLPQQYSFTADVQVCCYIVEIDVS